MTPEEKKERKEIAKTLDNIKNECRITWITEPGYIKNENEEHDGQYIRFVGASGRWEHIEECQESLIYCAALTFYKLKTEGKVSKILGFDIDSRPYYRFYGTDRAAWTMGYIMRMATASK